MLLERESREGVIQAVLAHFCGAECHGFGQVSELCESRRDCVIVVSCPRCQTSFVLNDDEYDRLMAWSASHSGALACGIEPLPA